MKTSNKLLLGTAICIVLGIFSFAFMMRGAYQKALANPVSMEESVSLKEMKYLNLKKSYSTINFKQGDKYEIIMQRDLKDSLKFDYQGDTLNLDVTLAGEVTIFVPKLPILSVNNIGDYEDRDVEIFVDKTFQSGEFVVTLLNNPCSILFQKSKFDKIEINSEKSSFISLEECDINLLKINLPKLSSLTVNNSTILSKNIVLGDSCDVILKGKSAQSAFLK